MATMTLGSFMPARLLDGAGNADRDVEVRRDDLAGLADLPVVSAHSPHRRRRRGRPQTAAPSLSAIGSITSSNVLLGAERAPARDDDLGRGQFGPLRMGDPVLDEAGKAPPSAAASTLSTLAEPPLARRLEGRGAHGDDFLGVAGLHRLDRIAGIDRGA